MKMIKRLLALNLVLVLLLTLMMPMSALAEGTGIAIDETNFPDENFRAYVSEKTIDKNQDGYLSEAEIKSCTIIYLQNYGITDLTGIEHFTSLEEFATEYNPIVYMPALPESLVQFGCIGTEFTTLPELPDGILRMICVGNDSLATFTNIPKQLNQLLCYWNAMTELPQLPEGLEYLICNENKLTELPELPQSLTHLDCGDNQLTSLPALPESLESLYCDDNHLTKIDRIPPKVNNFDCSGNLLTELPDLPDGIENMLCSRNQLTSLPELPTNLRMLECYNNQLKELPDLPTTLLGLMCNSNQLTQLPELPALTQLICNNNDLTSIELNSESEYATLLVSKNYLPDESAVTGCDIVWDGVNFIFGPQKQDYELAVDKAGAYVIDLYVPSVQFVSSEDLKLYDAEWGGYNGSGFSIESGNHVYRVAYLPDDCRYMLEVNDDLYMDQTWIDMLADDQYGEYEDYRDILKSYSITKTYAEPITVSGDMTISYTNEDELIAYELSSDACLTVSTTNGDGLYSRTTNGEQTAILHDWDIVFLRPESTGELKISASEHNWNIEKVGTPSCEDEDLTIYECATCKNKYYEAVMALGHDFGEDGICTRCSRIICEVENGEHVFTADGVCKYCGQLPCCTKTEPAAHEFDSNDVCTVCGKSVPAPLTADDGSMWTLTSDGKLTIENYTDGDYMSYFDGFEQNINSVVLGDGTTHLPNLSTACNYIRELYISSSMLPGEIAGRSICYEGLEQITVAEDSQYYCAVDGVLYNKDMTTLLQYPPMKEGTDFVIPDTVTYINAAAFILCRLESVYMPDSVTEMGIDAFEGAYNLKNVRLSNRLKEIPQNALDLCTSLEYIDIPNSVETMYRALRNCASLKTVKLSENLKELVDCFGSFGVKSEYVPLEIYVPNTVTYIRENFSEFEKVDIYYNGTAQQWNELCEASEVYTNGLSNFDNVTVHFLAEENTITSDKSQGADITVNVTPIGNAVTENVSLSVKPAEEAKADVVIEQLGNVKKAAYEISLVDAAGAEAQVENGFVVVELSVPENMNASDCTVYRVEEDGSLTDMGAILTESGTLRFSTEHFSLYVVAEKTECAHQNMTHATINPTCTADGYTVYTCSDCGYSYVGDKIAAGHSTELRNVKDVTCTEDGYTGDEVCTVCGETVSTGETVAATGHSYGDDNVCDNCGHKQSVTETIQIWISDTIQSIRNFFDKIFGII